MERFAFEQLGAEKGLHLFCTHSHTFAICPRCQLVISDFYDVKDRCVRHLDILEMRTFVHFPQRRFECEHCGKPFTENLAWIRPKRRQTSTFENYIYQRMQHKTPCKQVAQEEGWSESTVRELLPHAKIVADRFHMMKQLNHQIDLVRRAIQRQAQKTGDTALYQVLKGSRWVLLKDRAALNPEQRSQLQEILALSAELRQIYRLREEFRHICDKITNRARAERFLRAWALKAERTGNRYILKFVKTLRNGWEEFLNYFIERTTQGFVEGINRAIRGIINRAFGYRNFDNFRLQMLIECGGIDFTPRIRDDPDFLNVKHQSNRKA